MLDNLRQFPKQTLFSGHSMAKLLFRMRDVPDDEAKRFASRRRMKYRSLRPLQEIGEFLCGLWLVNEQQFDGARLMNIKREARESNLSIYGKKKRRNRNVLGKPAPNRCDSAYILASALVLFVTEVLCVILRRQKRGQLGFRCDKPSLKYNEHSNRAPQKSAPRPGNHFYLKSVSIPGAIQSVEEICLRLFSG